MANISNYLEERVLNHIFRGVESTSPATLYLALFLNNPTDAATGTEVSGTDYARQTITFSAPTQDGDGKGTIKNNTEIEFPSAGSSWGLVTHAAIYDGLEGGNMYYYGPLANPKDVQTSDILKVLENELVLTLA